LTRDFLSSRFQWSSEKEAIMITLYDLADTLTILTKAIERYHHYPSEENWNSVLMATEIANKNLILVYPEEVDL